MKPILGWHFADLDGTPGRGRLPKPIQAGVVYRVRPPLKICERGLHASRRALDALDTSNGPLVSRVRCSGTVIEDTRNVCCSKRTHLWVLDATRVLHEFEVEVAQKAFEAERRSGRDPDKRLWRRLELKRRWLEGRPSEVELAASTDAVCADSCFSVAFAVIAALVYALRANSASFLLLNARLEEMLEAAHAKVIEANEEVRR